LNIFYLLLFSACKDKVFCPQMDVVKRIFLKIVIFFRNAKMASSLREIFVLKIFFEKMRFFLFKNALYSKKYIYLCRLN